MGVTSGAVTPAEGNATAGIFPGTVKVEIYELGDANWEKVDPVEEVTAKVWAFGEKDAGYPVVISRDRSSVDLGGEDHWWVIWFPCDKVPVP